MLSFETRRFRLSIAVGIALTLLVCAADQIGLLTDFENWFYDVRAAKCQVFSRKPDDRIAHVDMDDAALAQGGIGIWPWPRNTLARIIDEIGRSKPAAIALDITLADTDSIDNTGNTEKIDEAAPAQTSSVANAIPAEDAMLSDALAVQKSAVMATSFKLKAPPHLSAEQSAAFEELSANLELSASAFYRKMSDRGFDQVSRMDLQDLYAHTLKIAMYNRVSRELTRAPLNDEELIARVLPHTVSGVNAPVLSRLQEEASAFRLRQEFRRFALNSGPGTVPIVPCDFDTIPLPQFSKNATYCGFDNCDLFPGATLRSLPLLLESENKLYPQFGLALGCAILGADVRQARVEANQIVIPKPGGADIVIPTHLVRSKTLNRDFSCIADIPWFGNSDWQTMYDWPNHLRGNNHISANVVWDICKTIDKIRRNNLDIDDAVQFILGTGETSFSLDPPYARNYAKSPRGPDDTGLREKVARTTLSKLADSQMIEGFAIIPTNELSAIERTQLANLRRYKATLESLVQVNADLQNQLLVQRSNLATRLAGKGVFLGWTAEGYYDVISTSIHSRVPGVVVHGVIAQAVISGRWPKRASIWIGPFLILLLGLATSYIVARLTPLRAVGSTILLAAVYLVLNGYVAFDYGSWIVPVAGPVTAITVVWSGCTLQRVIFEGIERVRVATEVAVISREMSLAHKVQAALIPKHPPNVAGLEAEGWTQPASTTGGDCYDLWQLPDGRLAILLADASGHGLAPAMIVSQVRTLVRALSEVDTHPRDLFRRVNTRVAEDLEPGYFVTAFLGFLSADGKLEYAAAGHGPQYWYGCDGDMFEIESTGVPLGFDNEWICDESEGCGAVQICAGGTLVIFSDGFYEAMAPDKALFGIDRMKEILETNRGKSGKIIIDSLTSAVVEWQKQRPPNDDQTVVVARRIDA